MTAAVVSLHDIAPRLARARDQLFAEREAAWQAELEYRDAQLRLERLIAHRELQLVRAQAVGDARYIKRRSEKLVTARKQLARLDRRRSAA